MQLKCSRTELKTQVWFKSVCSLWLCSQPWTSQCPNFALNNPLLALLWIKKNWLLKLYLYSHGGKGHGNTQILPNQWSDDNVQLMVCYKNVSEYRFQYADLRKSCLGKYLLIPILNTYIYLLGKYLLIPIFMLVRWMVFFFSFFRWMVFNGRF